MAHPLSLTDLPQDLLKKILSYNAQDPITLISCERTCHALKNIVADDSVWGLPPDGCEYKTGNMINYTDEEGTVWLANERVAVDTEDWVKDDRFVSNRERTCIWGVLEMIKKEQKRTDNILVSELGVSTLANLWESMGFYHTQADGQVVFQRTIECHCSEFPICWLRGDTLFVLCEVLQENLIKLLQHAVNVLELSSKQVAKYPLLNREVFEGVLTMVPPYIELTGDDDIRRHNDLPRDKVDKMVRRLSHRVGIPRMVNEVYDDMWCLLQIWAQQILRKAFAAAEFYYADRFIENGDDVTTWSQLPFIGMQRFFPVVMRRCLQPGDTMQNCSPCSLRYCTTCQKGILGSTMPVPQQIQDAATILKFPIVKVYGSGWLVHEDPSSNFSMQQRIQMEQYISQQEYVFESDADDTIAAFNQLLGDSDEDECSWDEGSTDSENDTLSHSSSAEEEEDVSMEEASKE